MKTTSMIFCIFVYNIFSISLNLTSNGQFKKICFHCVFLDNSSLYYLQFREIFKEVEKSEMVQSRVCQSEIEPSLFDVVEVTLRNARRTREEFCSANCLDRHFA